MATVRTFHGDRQQAGYRRREATVIHEVREPERVVVVGAKGEPEAVTDGVGDAGDPDATAGGVGRRGECRIGLRERPST
mgnify:CR=1 FL=1